MGYFSSFVPYFFKVFPTSHNKAFDKPASLTDALWFYFGEALLEAAWDRTSLGMLERAVNSLLQGEFPLHEAQAERYQLIEALTDDDLAYKLPGNNLTLGELCREIGEVEQNYIESFKTFEYVPTYRNTVPGLTTSGERLREWYLSLDQEFEVVMQGFSEDDLHTKEIDRGDGFKPSLHVQFEIYREALLMFYAKASIYLKALDKRVNDQWHAGIG